MPNMILNKYKYILKDVSTEKTIKVNKIVVLNRVTNAVTQNPGTFEETSYQRSVLEEKQDVIGGVRIEENTYSNENPLCKKLLELEATDKFPDTIKIVNTKNKVKQYKILMRQKREGCYDRK